MLLTLDEKYKETYEKNCKVGFPKPSPSHTYCSVCKFDYGIYYYAHILSSFHKDNIQKSTYNSYIIELTKEFSAQHPSDTSNLPSPFGFPKHLQGNSNEVLESKDSDS